MQIIMGVPSVLITGYPKFSNFEYNVSESILSLLKEIDFGEIKIFTELLYNSSKLISVLITNN